MVTSKVLASYHMVLPFVLAIIKNSKGEALIGQDSDSKRKPYSLFWNLPGGKLEKKKKIFFFIFLLFFFFFIYIIFFYFNFFFFFLFFKFFFFWVFISKIT